MVYTKKHGQWFPFHEHIKIHDDVLKKFEHLMVVPTEYSFDYPDKPSNTILRHLVKFEFSHNRYIVEIEKKSKIKKLYNAKTQLDEPVEALTIYYNYVARSKQSAHSLRYCSPHTNFYDPDNPWHHKHHRHESFVPNLEQIQIFDEDDRPYEDRIKKQFIIKNKSISTSYLGQIDWPNVMDFLKEVKNLP